MIEYSTDYSLATIGSIKSFSLSFYWTIQDFEFIAQINLSLLLNSDFHNHTFEFSLPFLSSPTQLSCLIQYFKCFFLTQVIQSSFTLFHLLFWVNRMHPYIMEEVIVQFLILLLIIALIDSNFSHLEQYFPLKPF